MAQSLFALCPVEASKAQLFCEIVALFAIKHNQNNKAHSNVIKAENQLNLMPHEFQSEHVQENIQSENTQVCNVHFCHCF